MYPIDMDGSTEVKRTKPTHPLHRSTLDMWMEPVQWISKQLIREGYAPVRAELVPELERWHWYDARGEHIFTARHELIEHVWDLLRFHDGA